MTRYFAVLTLFVSCTSAAWSGDGKEASLEGVWLPETAELGGKMFPDELRKTIRLEIKGDRYLVMVGSQPDRGTGKLDPSARPKALDITGIEGPNKGRTIPAIYERKGDSLRVCYNLGGKDRPTEFKSATGSALFLVEYRRHKE